MVQLDRVQNTYRVPDIRARGGSAHCLVSCLPHVVLLTDSHRDRVQNIGWPGMTEFKILSVYRLLVQEAIQLAAWSAAYPPSPTYRFPSWQSSEYWMVQLDRVQNTYRVPVISARGCSAHCLVGCQPRPVLHLQIPILTEFRIWNGPAWQSSKYFQGTDY